MHIESKEERDRRLTVRHIMALPLDPDRLDVFRRQSVQDREELQAFQKQFAKDRDYESAKFFKDAATECLKEYRACCLILAWFLCEPPADCVVRQAKDWPFELIPYAKRVAGIVDLPSHDPL